jgi:DNA gyrase/topoisomerase IV subunit A
VFHYYLPLTQSFRPCVLDIVLIKDLQKEVREKKVLEIIKNEALDLKSKFGDERKTVLDAATASIKALQCLKQGEVVNVTETKQDFKEGVQATKSYVTGEDVIKDLRDKGVKI